MGVCHSEQSEESHQINRLQILHFVQDDKRRLFTSPTKLSCVDFYPVILNLVQNLKKRDPETSSG